MINESLWRHTFDVLNIYSPLSKARKWNKIISWRYICKKKIKYMYNLIKGLVPIYKKQHLFSIYITSGSFSHICLQQSFIHQWSQDIELQHRLSGFSLWWVSFSEELLFQFVVASLHVHQLLVSPSLFNFATTYNNDLICVLDGLQPVSDHQEGLVGDARERLLNLCRDRRKKHY